MRPNLHLGERVGGRKQTQQHWQKPRFPSLGKHTRLIVLAVFPKSPACKVLTRSGEVSRTITV